MRIIAILLILLTLHSCSPEKRLARLIKNHPELADTGHTLVTVITPPVKKDTTFKYYTKDSVIVREGKLVMKYFYNNHDSTVFLQGECLPDTIYKNVATQSFNVKESKGWRDYATDPALWLGLIAIILILLKR